MFILFVSAHRKRAAECRMHLGEGPSGIRSIHIDVFTILHQIYDYRPLNGLILNIPSRNCRNLDSDRVVYHDHSCAGGSSTAVGWTREVLPLVPMSTCAGLYYQRHVPSDRPGVPRTRVSIPVWLKVFS